MKLFDRDDDGYWRYRMWRLHETMLGFRYRREAAWRVLAGRPVVYGVQFDVPVGEHMGPLDEVPWVFDQHTNRAAMVSGCVIRGAARPQP